MKSFLMKLIFGGCFLLSCFGVSARPVEAQFEDVEVLILNSYHPGYGWADEVIQGIYDTLYESGRVMNIHIEYMDGKRYSLVEQQSALFALYQRKYDPKALDLIIINDNIALNFAIDYYDEFFQYAPVVFCGIGYLGDYDFSQYNNMTGFGEDTKFLENLELIERLQPEVQHLYFIAGSSPTVLASRENFHNAIQNYSGKLQIHEIVDMTIEETLLKAQQIPPDSAIILIPYARDITGEYINWDAFLEVLSAKVNQAIYSTYSFQVTEHVVGGMVIDGYLHGEATAQRALEILNGRQPCDYLIEYDGGHYYLFNYAKMKNYGINARDLPPAAKLINEPTTAWYRYHGEMLVLTGIFLSLVLLVVILLVNIRRKKAAETRLRYLNSYDPMTGVHNRHAYVQRLERYQSFGANQMYPIGILYIDMDGLKVVNERFGHEGGDQYIISVARLLQTHFDAHHFIARIGGDEFIILKERVDEELWLEQIDQLREVVQEKDLQFEAYHFGISMGWVICQDVKLLTKAIQDADHFMYQNKYAQKEFFGYSSVHDQKQ